MDPHDEQTLTSEAAIRRACSSMVQSAFTVLVQDVLKKDDAGLKRFIDAVVLLELVRDQSIKALQGRRAYKSQPIPEHPADIFKRELNS